MSVLRLDNNIAKSIYKGKNILVLQTIKYLRLKSSLTVKKKYTFDAV